jgi:hypothetical protein
MYKQEVGDMPKASLDDVWIYVYENEYVRTRDLETQFVKTKQLARGTLYKYKRLLEAEGKIRAKPVQGRPPYNLYYVPKKYHDELEALKQYKYLSPKYFQFDTYNKRAGSIPDDYYPKVPIMGNIDNLEWEDTAPEDFYSDVKRKVLWKNDATGALFVLLKVPPGIMEPLHYHTESNKWALALSGECELPDGTRMPMEGVYGYIAKGTPHVHPKVTKETLILCYFNGPRTKTLIQP